MGGHSQQKVPYHVKTQTVGILDIFCNIVPLEGTAAYGHLLLAPAEGWWPSATWRALQALFSFRYLEGLLPIIFI